jgi:hypothetical protein
MAEPAAKKQRSGSPAPSVDSSIYREEFIGYKPNIKLLDCTIRDGGLMNKWQFTDDFIRAVYDACSAAGVDYMEIGYLTSESYFKRR